MTGPTAGRITQPLLDLAKQGADDIFHVVVRVRTEPGAAAAAFDDVARALGTVATTIEALGTEAGSPAHAARVVWNGASAGAPFLYAVLTGANVLRLDRMLDASLPVAIYRDRVAMAAAATPQPGPATPAAAFAPLPGPSAAPVTTRAPFDADDLTPRVVAEPLASKIRNDPTQTYAVIVVLDATYAAGQKAARNAVSAAIAKIGDRTAPIDPTINDGASHPYVYAKMTGAQVLAVLELDRNTPDVAPAIRCIWEDHVVSAFITRSIATVKADAAQIAYGAAGKGIVWAVLDSGIDGTHPHFRARKNLDLDAKRPLRHRDFLNPGNDQTKDDATALLDPFGHGTHVAGIIAGSWRATDVPDQKPTILSVTRDEAGADERSLSFPPVVTGMAPDCTLISMRVLDENGNGRVSAIIDAFEAIQELNGFGRRIVIHGVNLSAGYAFDAKWYACGASPLCDEVNRLVRSGVVVVVAAGNSGYGTISTAYTQGWAATLPQTINDPGNADLAITVGSTHRTAPHTFGISYFSSKGPTGDGRMKPDLVAPGERIVSCASAQVTLPATVATSSGTQTLTAANGYTYREDSGTSMAAPHVSGVVAAFLSIRPEYCGQPEAVKDLFVSNATDLKRDRTFQGSGLVDLMRTIAAV
jgi:subtilisin family serine protease